MGANAVVTPAGGDLSGLSSSGGDITSELGSLLGEGYDAAMGGEETPIGEEGTPASPGTETPVETPPGEEAAAPVQPTTPDDTAQAQPATEPYPLSQDGKSYLVPKAEIPNFQSAMQYAQAVQERFPTPQDAEAAYLMSADYRIMLNDMIDGSQPALEGVLAHLSGANHGQNPAVQARLQQSFLKMAEMVPTYLERANPQAYQNFIGTPARFDAQGNQISPASGLLAKAVEAAYARAAQTGNPADFERAKELDYGVTGTYKNELPRVDPQAQQMTDFQRREQAFNQRQEMALQRDRASFNQSQVEGAKFTELNSQIDKLLAPVAKNYPEPTLAAVKTAIQSEVMNALKADPEWWLLHEQEFHQLIADYNTTWQQGNPGAGLAPRIQAYKNDFLSRASRKLPSIVQKHLNAATASRTRSTNGQFAANKTPQTRPAAPATPANQPATPESRADRSARVDKEWNDLFAPFRA